MGASAVGGGGLASGGDAGGKSCPATGQIRVNKKGSADAGVLSCSNGHTFAPCGQVFLQVAPITTVVDASVIAHQTERDTLPIPAVKVRLTAAL